MRILIVEDERRLADIIARVLQQERHDVDIATDGSEGLDLALSGAYAAIILDRMLPGLDGLQVTRELRAEGVTTPILMLTALGDLPERVEGLDAGADDYLGKPFAFEELLARLRALLRRTDRPLAPETIVLGPIELDLTARTVTRDGTFIELTPREFALLELLARNRGRVFSRDELLERVWGYDADPRGNIVDLYIHYLRRKLDPAPPGDGSGGPSPSLIRTVRGAGYVIPRDD